MVAAVAAAELAFYRISRRSRLEAFCRELHTTSTTLIGPNPANQIVIFDVSDSKVNAANYTPKSTPIPSFR